jgi:AraC-like DNA-binding protein
LGYGSASAFISMFKRLVGATPDEFRRGDKARDRAGVTPDAASAVGPHNVLPK